MPRLRYLKNPTRLEREWEFEYVGNSNANGRTEESEEFDSSEITGESWLSNSAIMRTFPTPKLEYLIARYKTFILLAQRELDLRANNHMFVEPSISEYPKQLRSEFRRVQQLAERRNSKSRLWAERQTCYTFLSKNLRNREKAKKVLQDWLIILASNDKKENNNG
jgi:hypothetical protein